MNNEQREETTAKKTTVKRLLIFLAISFVPFYIIIPVMWSYFGEPIFVCENAAVANYVVGVFCMMIPSCAHLLTRLFTKEGFKNTYLGLNCKGRMGYYTASVAVPLAYSFIALFLLWAIYGGGMTMPEAFPNVNLQSIGVFLMQISCTVIFFFPGFGEEWGWRGYMMPKLMELMPKPFAVIVGGIIWGLWHAPLTVAGHNFGTDYPGYPFVGIGFMCLLCVCMNAFLTLITEKTKSIYPAAFAHAVNNNMSCAILISIFGSEALTEKADTLPVIESFIPYIGILAVVGIVSFVLLIRKENT
ncbi:MAG: CPBP family intramembrane metalloprotease [Ruminiclostridium sp.]|nr:CPBP family intramembrane metalloprotease [Ruminiclostridium sp.]